MKKFNRHGFTLAELLIVVAIIAVLVAVAIPVFNSQLEKARETTDVANLRSAYAEAVAKFLDEDVDSEGKAISATYRVQQRVQNWSKTTVADALPAELKDAGNTLKTTTSGTFAVKVGQGGTNSDGVAVTFVPNPTGGGTTPSDDANDD